ncbi:MAG: hypothetical protein KTR15_05610 [Phycisphaeraceae bacterium]|nr:hypothetical protein [Phycisphaeraceae bacterium]
MKCWSTLAIVLFLLSALGCQTPQTSRIAVDDYVEMTAAMAQSLRQSDAFTRRSPASEPWVVSFDKVLNLSSEIMTQGEQWGVVAMVRGAQPINSLWNDKRVAFVIPAQYAIDQRGTLDAERADKGFGSERGVTHTVTSTFRSVTRVGEGGNGRTDVYACEFQMLDLNTNEPVWLDTFEFKRTATGSVRD